MHILEFGSTSHLPSQNNLSADMYSSSHGHIRNILSRTYTFCLALYIYKYYYDNINKNLLVSVIDKWVFFRYFVDV